MSYEGSIPDLEYMYQHLEDTSGDRWPGLEYLSETVTNPNIHVAGTHSYYSGLQDGRFEDTAVRFLSPTAEGLPFGEHGERDPVDQLHIGDYVGISAKVVILMGGNHAHRPDYFHLYSVPESVSRLFRSVGDTVIGDGTILGMRSSIMPGVVIGEGTYVAACSVVTRDIPPYSLVGGNPARPLRDRFPQRVIDALVSLNIYGWSYAKLKAMRPYLYSSDVAALVDASERYDSTSGGGNPAAWPGLRP